MTDLDPLIFDFLEWLAREPRSYADVMDAWRTSCPRLTVWEDANDRRLIERTRGAEQRDIVALSAAGAEFLTTHGSAARR